MSFRSTKNLKLLMLIMLFVAVSMFRVGDVAAQEQGEDEITVEQSGQGEWSIIKSGEVVGILKSDTLRSFTFFNTTDVFMGTIRESKVWFHRLYRKRDTRITSEEAKLYMDALKAIEIIKR